MVKFGLGAMYGEDAAEKSAFSIPCKKCNPMSPSLSYALAISIKTWRRWQSINLTMPLGGAAAASAGHHFMDREERRSEEETGKGSGVKGRKEGRKGE